MNSYRATGTRPNDSPLPSPLAGVNSKKSHTRLGSRKLYKIRHWLPVLPGSLTTVPSTTRIGPSGVPSSPETPFSRSNSRHKVRSHSSLFRNRLSKADIRNAGPVRQSSVHHSFAQRVTACNVEQ